MRGLYEEHLCEILLNLGQLTFKDFLFLALVAILSSGAEPFGQFGRRPMRQLCQII